MADWTDNPFSAAPSDGQKQDEAFNDPSIAAATTDVPEYNPFDGSVPAAATGGGTDAPPNWATKSAEAEAPAKKSKAPKNTKVSAEEEERLNNYAENEAGADKDPNYRPANWPPFPGFCRWPFHACFHHDFQGEIPDWGYGTLKRMYQMWLLYFLVLFWNLVCSLASIGCSNCESTGSQAGFALLWFLLFSPLSYMCWFQPLYQAMRKDSSLRFGWFFLNAAIQFIFACIAAIGIEGSGHCGLISATVALAGDGGDKVIGIMMMVCAGLWILFALYCGYMIQRVLRLYRSTGQSLEKAQNEAVVGAVSSDAGKKAVFGAVKASL